eukprot:Gregarina_sp_Poly_1__4989@NODE_2644_length_1877_cov_244_571271_g1677_i0_p1_GENE_NODE_2644_length_1877_cov_244_571271_g1677_i0NODE_2644_length_1877_cov_244_571271_g1677_i0_p1_ORF_typecomplete_len106_score2_38HSP70/PF00012_20/0_019Gram_pos_anchor/PF00746_21/1_4_NODE_2644_length_1877_cov_244_571271_g1677_i010171334
MKSSLLTGSSTINVLLAIALLSMASRNGQRTDALYLYYGYMLSRKSSPVHHSESSSLGHNVLFIDYGGASLDVLFVRCSPVGCALLSYEYNDSVGRDFVGDAIIE